jgi:hypothetical protein
MGGSRRIKYVDSPLPKSLIGDYCPAIMPILLQIDFPFPGPFGPELAREANDLASSIARAPGLLWTIWVENAEAREAGGVYLFTDKRSAEAFLAVHTARLAERGISEPRSKIFEVNTELSALTRAPLK